MNVLSPLISVARWPLSFNPLTPWTKGKTKICENTLGGNLKFTESNPNKSFINIYHLSVTEYPLKIPLGFLALVLGAEDGNLRSSGSQGPRRSKRRCLKSSTGKSPNGAGNLRLAGGAAIVGSDECRAHIAKLKLWNRRSFEVHRHAPNVEPCDISWDGIAWLV